MISRKDCRGEVTKIIRVPFASAAADESPSRKVDGYGILRTEMGKDVFFEGTVVANGMFDSLSIGDQVIYKLQEGLLAHASRVWVQSVDQDWQQTSRTQP